MKKILLSLAVVLGILATANGVLAADFDVSCATTTCTPGTITGFFPDTEVWYPTKSFSQTIKLTNTSVNTQAIKARPERRDEVDLEGTDLAQSIQFTIVRSSDGVTVWDGSLYSFYGTGGIDLTSTLTVGSSETFTFTGYMYQDAGNEYQLLKTWFDMYIEAVTEMTPTPTPNPNCTITAAAVPGPLSLERLSSSDVKVTWGKSTGATGYEITWGDDLNANNKGSKSVGDTGETTVGGLNLDTTRYYFHLRSIKDCAKSDWNGTRSIGTGVDLLLSSPTPTPTGTVLGLTTAFTGGQVQGAATISPSVTPDATPTPTQEGQVKGESTAPCQCIWWQVLLGEAIIILAYLWFVARDMTNKRNHIASGILAILAYIIFLFVNKCLNKTFFVVVTSGSIFCRFFWVLDLLVLVSGILLATKLKKKNTD